LRHTFASHFIMNGGHIVTLQHILGHASLSMTMRYAHLMVVSHLAVLHCDWQRELVKWACRNRYYC
ncbi:tyrosine-type recombinase/integrase, partial [Pseudomonas aeruginosa]|uniref:tyrosine-type recombinase/integrase n=1 Tax=Pseudomonas aeruginosa TaxID=287 RepID=UPI003A4E39C1